MHEKFDKKFKLNDKYKKDFQDLQEIIKILKEEGLSITHYCQSEKIVQTQWDTNSTFLIANEGAKAVKITRWPQGGLTVSFTNGFDDPNDPKRIRITAKLREKGFDVA